MSAQIVSIESRFVSTRREPIPAVGVDTEKVRHQVRSHAFRIGCDESNATAAVNYGLKCGNTTEDAIREGNRRAEKLAGQQPTPPEAA